MRGETVKVVFSCLALFPHDQMRNTSDKWTRRMTQYNGMMMSVEPLQVHGKSSAEYETSHIVCNGKYQGQTNVTLSKT